MTVEVVEEEEKLQAMAILPELDTMLSGGLSTLERARVVLYRPTDSPDG